MQNTPSALMTVVQRKGWTQEQLAEHWDVSSRHIRRSFKNPDARTVDAVNGLSERKNNDK
jgi:transcriptional antiterminator